MYEQVDKHKGNSPSVGSQENTSLTNTVYQKMSNDSQGIGFTDKRNDSFSLTKTHGKSSSFGSTPAGLSNSYGSVIQNNRPNAIDDVLQLTAYVSKAEAYWDDDDPSKGVLDDNFDSKIKGKLKKPTAEATVSSYVENNRNKKVVLWRGETAAKAALIIANGSAGGSAADANTTQATLAQVNAQVGGGRAHPEYTTDTNSSWSAGSWLVVVKINTKYLKKGSGSEGGWIALSSAPVEVLDTVDRTIIDPSELGGGGFAHANAS